MGGDFHKQLANMISARPLGCIPSLNRELLINIILHMLLFLHESAWFAGGLKQKADTWTVDSRQVFD